MVAFSIFEIGHMTYSNVRFSLSKVALEDSWLVQFLPSVAQEIVFIKIKDIVPASKKPYGNDGFNGKAINTKGTDMPDMIGYYNFFLSEEEVTITR